MRIATRDLVPRLDSFLDSADEARPLDVFGVSSPTARQWWCRMLHRHPPLLTGRGQWRCRSCGAEWATAAQGHFRPEIANRAAAERARLLARRESVLQAMRSREQLCNDVREWWRKAVRDIS